MTSRLRRFDDGRWRDHEKESSFVIEAKRSHSSSDDAMTLAATPLRMTAADAAMKEDFIRH